MEHVCRVKALLEAHHTSKGFLQELGRLQSAGNVFLWRCTCRSHAKTCPVTFHGIRFGSSLFESIDRCKAERKLVSFDVIFLKIYTLQSRFDDGTWMERRPDFDSEDPPVI